MTNLFNLIDVFTAHKYAKKNPKYQGGTAYRLLLYECNTGGPR